MKQFSYKKCGVDIKKADNFARNIKAQSSSRLEAFGSVFSLAGILKNYRQPLLVSSADGVGTKLIVAQRLNIHNTVGIDLVAMNVNDIICTGARPLFFLDYIACGKLDLKILTSAVKGIKKGLKDSNCLLLGGETAEMPDMYKPGDYDLAGFCVGVVDKNKIIDGKAIGKTDLLIGLASSGLHSNGFSLVRKVLSRKDMIKYAKEVLRPTRIYVKPILSLLENKIFSRSIKGISHVTGGAFYNKAVKVLPKGLGMQINKNSWPVPNIFKVIQKQGSVSEKEMYTVFNMGIGMVLTVDKTKAKKILTQLNKTCKSYIIGEVIKSSKKMILEK